MFFFRRDENSTVLPLCLNGILNKNEFDYSPDTNFRRDHWTMVRPKRRCLLHQYNRQDVARCLDSPFISLPLEDDRKLSFAFIGDSRIRHQFYSFMEVCETNGKEYYYNYLSNKFSFPFFSDDARS